MSGREGFPKGGGGNKIPDRGGGGRGGGVWTLNVIPNYLI